MVSIMFSGWRIHFVNKGAECKRVCVCVTSYHHEGVSYPQRFPIRRASGNLDGLTVNCNHHGWSFTHWAPTHTRTHTRKWNEMKDLASFHIHDFFFPLSSLTCWCKAWCPLQWLGPWTWAWARAWTASRSSRCGRRSCRRCWCCRTWRAWCWTCADSCQPSLEQRMEKKKKAKYIKYFS